MTNGNDIYDTTASACFYLASDYIRRVNHEVPLRPRDHDVALCEVLCFLLHFLSRLLFDADPQSIDVRMSALSTAALQQFTRCARANVKQKTFDPSLWPPEYGANNRIVTRQQADAARIRVIQALNEDALNQATAQATEMFMNLYVDRMDEYGMISGDWFRSLLPRFSKRFCEAITLGDFSVELFLKASGETVPMLEALGEFLPELLSPTAT
jgi:hypothetical protein